MVQAWSIGKVPKKSKLNDINFSSNSPGPGAYKLTSPEKVHKSGPKWTFASKQRMKYETNVPGPGNYSMRKVKEDGPSFSFGSQN